eukprot:217890-Alexandrium_andersonii.AAC.1
MLGKLPGCPGLLRHGVQRRPGHKPTFCLVLHAYGGGWWWWAGRGGKYRGFFFLQPTERRAQ